MKTIVVTFMEKGFKSSPFFCYNKFDYLYYYLKNMDLRLLALIIHLIGFAFGLGGATISDVMFFKILRTRKLGSDELNTLITFSHIIWVGLGLLIISGLSIFAMIYAEQGSLPLLASPRWQAKLTLVGLVFINGLVFKYSILPFLRKNINQEISLRTFNPKIWQLAFSGALSIVSWYSILIISALPREFRPHYLLFMGVWLCFVLLGTLMGRYMLKKSIS